MWKICLILLILAGSTFAEINLGEGVIVPVVDTINYMKTTDSDFGVDTVCAQLGYLADSSYFDCDIVDLVWDNAIVTGVGYTLVDNHCPKKHDPDREYIERIAEVCDTAISKGWKIFEIDGRKYAEVVYVVDSISCRIDTTWADKVPVYLTPEQVRVLKTMLPTDEIEYLGTVIWDNSEN